MRDSPLCMRARRLRIFTSTSKLSKQRRPCEHDGVSLRRRCNKTTARARRQDCRSLLQGWSNTNQARLSVPRWTPATKKNHHVFVLVFSHVIVFCLFGMKLGHRELAKTVAELFVRCWHESPQPCSQAPVTVPQRGIRNGHPKKGCFEMAETCALRD